MATVKDGRKLDGIEEADGQKSGTAATASRDVKADALARTAGAEPRTPSKPPRPEFLRRTADPDEASNHRQTPVDADQGAGGLGVRREGGAQHQVVGDRAADGDLSAHVGEYRNRAERQASDASSR